MSTLLADNEVVTAIVVPVASARPGLRACEVLAPGIALRGDWCGGVGDDGGEHVLGRAHRARRAAAARDPRARSRRGAHGRVARRRPRSRTRRRRCRRISAATVLGDIFASSAYRTAVAPVYVKRAVASRPRRAPGLRELGAALSIPASVDALQEALAGERLYRRTRAGWCRSTSRCGCERPLFLEGEAGVGKPKSPRCSPSALEHVRSSACSATKASTSARLSTSGTSPRQLLEIRMIEADDGTRSHRRPRASSFTETFLIKRPLLRAIEDDAANAPPVLLIDEIDRADEGVRGLPARVPLGLPGDASRSSGRSARSNRRSSSITSNRTREVHDALEAPLRLQLDPVSQLREANSASCSSKVPGASERLARQVTAFVQELRTADLYKAAGISRRSTGPLRSWRWIVSVARCGRRSTDARHPAEEPGRHRRRARRSGSDTDLARCAHVGRCAAGLMRARRDGADPPDSWSQPAALRPRAACGGRPGASRADGGRHPGAPNAVGVKQPRGRARDAVLAARASPRGPGALQPGLRSVLPRARLVGAGPAAVLARRAARGWSPGATRARRRALDVEEPASEAPRSRGIRAWRHSTVEVSRTSKDFADFTAAELEAARRLLLRHVDGSQAAAHAQMERSLRRRASTWRDLLRTNVMRGGELVKLPRRVRRATRAPDRAARRRQRIDGPLQPHAAVVSPCGLTRSAAPTWRASSSRRVSRACHATSPATGRTSRRSSRMVRDLHDWGGGTRIGEALRTFNTTWARRVMRHGPVVADRVRMDGTVAIPDTSSAASCARPAALLRV